MTTKKEKIEKLLVLLAQEADFKTANDLAQQMELSAKTIYRLIKEINQDRRIVDSEKGKGFKLNQAIYLQDELSMTNQRPLDGPLQRQETILERLLLVSPQPLRIYDLAEEYFVSQAVILKDTLFIKNLIKDYRLDLLNRKQTLAIVGEEINVRRAIADLVSTFSTIDVEQIGLLEQGKALDDSLAVFVQKEIQFIEKTINAKIPYPYNINIFSHLYIMIERMRKGMFWPKGDEPRPQSDDLLLTTSWRVIEDVEAYLGHSINKIEVHYLYQYLISSRFQDLSNHSQTFQFPQQVIEITKIYFEEMLPDSSENLDQGSPIFVDLANHISPMLKRLENKIRVKNKMLSQIRASFPDIFQACREISDKISQRYGFPQINLDEVGFITLYFARFRELEKRPIRTIIMCTSGIGTSELLRSRIENLFTDLEIVSVLAYEDLDHVKQRYGDIDLLITTIDLEVPQQISKILVSAIMTEDDRRRLSQKIEEIHYGR